MLHTADVPAQNPISTFQHMLHLGALPSLSSSLHVPGCLVFGFAVRGFRMCSSLTRGTFYFSDMPLLRVIIRRLTWLKVQELRYYCCTLASSVESYCCETLLRHSSPPRGYGRLARTLNDWGYRKQINCLQALRTNLPRPPARKQHIPQQNIVVLAHQGFYFLHTAGKRPHRATRRLESLVDLSLGRLVRLCGLEQGERSGIWLSSITSHSTQRERVRSFLESFIPRKM